jgi:tRNA(Ile)-lysidine synthase
LPARTDARGLLHAVESTIRNRRLFEEGAHVIVACSGGGDSVALLLALVALSDRLSLRVSCAAVDHGLRPEAKDEVAFVGAIAGAHGVPFYALAVDVGLGASVQAHARERRYAALLSLATSLGADCVATGHTLDDQAETVLSRLLRDGGLRGLSALLPRREDGVVRPLIDCSRASLRAYLSSKSQPFLEDPSNHDGRFERVRIRRELLPLLESIRPRATEKLALLADEARALTHDLEHEDARVRSLSDRLSLAELDLETDVVVTRAVVERARREGVDLARTQREALLRVVRTRRGRVSLADGVVFAVEDGELRLVRSAKVQGRGRR